MILCCKITLGLSLLQQSTTTSVTSARHPQHPQQQVFLLL